jgi:PKD repeat protein
VRRGLVCAVALLILIPAASAAAPAVTIQASPSVGQAPLLVTFTAAGDASSYHWDFGDGVSADGASVQHTYSAGRRTATLTARSTTGEASTQTTMISAYGLTLAAPNPARYGRRVAFRGALVPAEGNVAVSLDGPRGKVATVRTKPNGTYTLAARVRQPGAYVATSERASSTPLELRIAPKLVTHLVGSGARGSAYFLTADLTPAAAGKLAVKITRGIDVVLDRTFQSRARVRLDTRKLTRYVVRVEALPSAGYSGIARVLRANVVLPRLAEGAARPRFALPGSHLEINKGLQVLYVVKSSRVGLIVPISTAGMPGTFTPVGRFAVYRKVVGFDPSPLGTLYDPLYFTGGYAIHGNPSVPPYPASHGCVRVPMWVAPYLYRTVPYGATVYVY